MIKIDILPFLETLETTGTLRFCWLADVKHVVEDMAVVL
jgi:hypothetical protein